MPEVTGNVAAACGPVVRMLFPDGMARDFGEVV
jgi:hypothetical protein